MGDGLSLACMFGTVTSIEETAVDGNEGVVVFTFSSRQQADIKVLILERIVIHRTFSASLPHGSK